MSNFKKALNFYKAVNWEKALNFDKGVIFKSSNKTKNFKDIESKLLNTSGKLYDQLKNISFN